MPQTPSTQYDYIIAGAGAAGLSLVAKMINSGKFSHKRILLVDKGPKTTNDRTWCFWEREDNFFESIVFKSWSLLWFHAAGFSKQFDIAPYRYKMIRGIDFYNYCFELINPQQNIKIKYGVVHDLCSNDNETSLHVDNEKFTADYIFNSIVFEKPAVKQTEFYLLQHFKGWIIQTNKPFFAEQEATLMDFRVSQLQGTAFVYVMPFSPDRALVEYTMFSPQLLEQPEYDRNLHDYISNWLGCSAYTVSSEEFGVIPMTNFPFQKTDHHIINIGTAGGQTKASSGYTFQFIQKKTAEIVAALARGDDPAKLQTTSPKYNFYDSVLLNVLATGKMPGDKIFTHLFRKNPAGNIFRFLDNETSFMEDLKLMTTLPTMPFLKAGLKEIF